MLKKSISRRQFIAATSVGTLCTVASGNASSLVTFGSKDSLKPAVLGGKPIRSKSYSSWPYWDKADEEAVIPVLRSGVWSRNKVVDAAEKKFAELMGTKRCLLTFCGTQALITSLHTVGVGGGG